MTFEGQHRHKMVFAKTSVLQTGLTRGTKNYSSCEMVDYVKLGCTNVTMVYVKMSWCFLRFFFYTFIGAPFCLPTFCWASSTRFKPAIFAWLMVACLAFLPLRTSEANLTSLCKICFARVLAFFLPRTKRF